MTLDTLFLNLDNTLLSDEDANQMAFDRTLAFLRRQMPELDVQGLELELRNQAQNLFEASPIYDFALQIGISPLDGLWGSFTDDDLRFPEFANFMPVYRHEVWARSLKTIGLSDLRLSKLLSLMYMTIRTETVCVYPDTFEALEGLSERYQLILLTNGAPSLQRLKISKAAKLKNYFNKIVISGDFGQGKPAPNFFEFALSRARATQTTSLVIGADLFTDILGANTVGIPSVWLNRLKLPENEAVTADYTISSLTELEPLIQKAGL